MNTWLTPMCQWSATDDATTFGITCAVLAALLLVFIALGFGPLGTWLGMHAGRGRLARRSPSEASGLLATWRLYRQLGRGTHFSVPDVPSLMVPDRVAENAQDKPPASGPTTAYHWMGYRRLAILVDTNG
jgi:hypothetical protein